jgi:hypothetical protein
VSPATASGSPVCLLTSAVWRLLVLQCSLEPLTCAVTLTLSTTTKSPPVTSANTARRGSRDLMPSVESVFSSSSFIAPLALQSALMRYSPFSARILQHKRSYCLKRNELESGPYIDDDVNNLEHFATSAAHQNQDFPQYQPFQSGPEMDYPDGL